MTDSLVFLKSYGKLCSIIDFTTYSELLRNSCTDLDAQSLFSKVDRDLLFANLEPTSEAFYVESSYPKKQSECTSL